MFSIYFLSAHSWPYFKIIHQWMLLVLGLESRVADIQKQYSKEKLSSIGFKNKGDFLFIYAFG